MNINTTSSRTLLDYINQYENGVNDLASLTSQSWQSQQSGVQEVESSLVSVSSIDELVNKIQKGDSNASPKTIADMVQFYQRQVSAEVSELAQDKGLLSVQNLTVTDGQWQYVAADGNESAATGKAEQTFIDYLNKDTRLSERMGKLLSLTQLNEVNTAKSNASQLQQAGASSETVETYLLDARESIRANNILTLSSEGLKTVATGQANSLFEDYMQDRE